MIDIQRSHDAQIHLCRRLEHIADTLPFNVDRLQSICLANTLLPLLRECHVYEETFVFPDLENRSERTSVFDQLRFDHLEDECAAQELTDTLLRIGGGHPIDNPEALGFMLRAFFSSLRRHVMLEKQLLASMDGGRDEL